MKNILLIIIIAILFSGCMTSSLTLTSKKSLDLQYDDKMYVVSDNVKSQGLLNFKDLLVWQYKITNEDGSVLFYEYADTDIRYEFNFMELSTVMYIFDDSKKYEKIYVRNNLTLAQIQLKNKKYVNVLIEGNTSQTYSFVYGFSNKEFLKLAKMLQVKDTKLGELKFEGVTFDSSSKALTNWNDLLVFFTPLIIPNREFSGGSGGG